jgi:hypothetical protein
MGDVVGSSLSIMSAKENCCPKNTMPSTAARSLGRLFCFLEDVQFETRFREDVVHESWV